jgi:hypothetical protein
LFSKTLPLGFPPRAVHQALMRFNAKNTNFMTLLNSFLQRDLERAERLARREAGAMGEDVFDGDDDLDADDSSDLEPEREDGEDEAIALEAKSGTVPVETTPVILTPPVSENSAQKTQDVLNAVDTAAKPVLLAKLAEQLQQRDEEAPVVRKAVHEASDLIQDVVLPFVEALRHAEDSETKKTASHRFLLDVSRMTPAEKVMNNDVQNALNTSALEQLGIPEVPMPFDFEGEQGLLNQLVEVAESVVAEVVSVDNSPPVEDVFTEEPSEQDEDDEESTGQATGTSANLDELIKRKRHALNKQSGLKPKKRSAQNHKKKKK